MHHVPTRVGQGARRRVRRRALVVLAARTARRCTPSFLAAVHIEDLRRRRAVFLADLHDPSTGALALGRRLRAAVERRRRGRLRAFGHDALLPSRLCQAHGVARVRVAHDAREYFSNKGSDIRSVRKLRAATPGKEDPYDCKNSLPARPSRMPRAAHTRLTVLAVERMRGGARVVTRRAPRPPERHARAWLARAHARHPPRRRDAHRCW